MAISHFNSPNRHCDITPAFNLRSLCNLYTSCYESDGFSSPSLQPRQQNNSTISTKNSNSCNVEMIMHRNLQIFSNGIPFSPRFPAELRIQATPVSPYHSGDASRRRLPMPRTRHFGHASKHRSSLEHRNEPDYAFSELYSCQAAFHSKQFSGNSYLKAVPG